MLDPFKRGIELRKTLVKDGKVLCVDFAATLQKQDITKDLIQDVDIGKYAYRAKVNVKALDSELRKQKGLAPFDFSDSEAIMRELNHDDAFDIPLWFLRKAGDKLENIAKYDLPMIYQIKGCNFHDGSSSGGCHFCFVDDNSNNGCLKGGVYLSAENIANTFERYRKEKGLLTLRTSGGEPTLVLDHILGLYKELSRKNLPILAQFDSNLSTARLIEYLEQQGIYPQHILEKIAEYDPKVLVAFKGTDNENLMGNIQAGLKVKNQIDAVKKFVKAGIDIYPYFYNPNPDTLEDFLEQLDKHFENILPKIHLGKIKLFSPAKKRLEIMAQQSGEDAEKAVRDYFERADKNYEKSIAIMNKVLNERYGVNYKQLERPGIKIKVRKKIFMICPVRNMVEQENQFLQKYIAELESKGNIVHYPPRDTKQDDPIGLNICTENRQGIRNADEVHIYWNPTSSGSGFDFGMTFMAEKPIVLFNKDKVQRTPHKSFENVLLELDAKYRKNIK